MKLIEVAKSHPLQVKCPTCGAGIGRKCRSVTDPEITFDQYHNTRKAVVENIRKFGRNL